MRLPTFRPDRQAVGELRRQQSFVRDEGFLSLSQIELFETNSRFHEGLAALSGNRFIQQAIVRQNQLRRLVEYRRPLDRDRARRVAEEHLAILAHLGEGRVEQAAAALAEHLAFAHREKAEGLVEGEPRPPIVVARPGAGLIQIK